MPIYEYCCTSCKHKFEDFSHVSSKNPVCPKCNCEVEKLMSRFSGVVTGSENRTIDCIVGADADKRRGYLEKRAEKQKTSTIVS